jgi:predicted AAA+ superfamily ATPase
MAKQMRIPRRLRAIALERSTRYPTLTITGPRQSGKTTLCREAFPDLAYVNLEDQTTREQALSDPSGFVARLHGGAVLDEVQRAPELLSAIQVAVDASAQNGRFVLSGSHNFQLHSAIDQSLAGRTSVLDLLPPALDELRQFATAPRDLPPTLFHGAYPRIFDQGIPVSEFMADYVRTYVERDVRLLLNVQDLGTFQTFLRLCAGRTGSLLNLTALASDAGISHVTAKAWIGLLEASYIVKRIQPWNRNLGKRLVKTPKLHFLDSGLLCWLLDIRSASQVETHPLRGQIFESWVVAEVLKARANAGLSDPVWFFRDKSGTEIDLMLDLPDRRVLVETKSGGRVAPDGTAHLHEVAEHMAGDPLLRGSIDRIVVYGGGERVTVNGVELLPWSQVPAYSWR